MNGYIEKRNHRPDPFANQILPNILHETHIHSHIQVEKKNIFQTPDRSIADWGGLQQVPSW